MTDNDKGRFLIGITTPSDFIPPKGFEVFEIPSGRYAVTRVSGRYYEMDKVYRELYLDWLPDLPLPFFILMDARPLAASTFAEPPAVP